MYISGDLMSFISRFHQLPTGSADLRDFETEAYSISGISEFPLFHAQKELEKQTLIVLSSGISYTNFLTGTRYF